MHLLVEFPSIWIYLKDFGWLGTSRFGNAPFVLASALHSYFRYLFVLLNVFSLCFLMFPEEVER